MRLKAILCALAVLTLAGCGDENEPETSASATSTTAPSVTTGECPSVIVAVLSDEQRSGEATKLVVIDAETGGLSRTLVESGNAIGLDEVSTDGKYAYYLQDAPADDGEASLKRVLITGGTPETLVDGMIRPAVSPDGSKVAYLPTSESESVSEEWRILDVATKESRAITSGFSTSDLYWTSSPAWSPDSKRIAAATGSKRLDDDPSNPTVLPLVVLDVDKVTSRDDARRLTPTLPPNPPEGSRIAWNQPSFAADGTLFAAESLFSAGAIETRWILLDSEGKVIRTVEENPPDVLGTVLTSTDLRCILHTEGPADEAGPAEPGAKYKLILRREGDASKTLFESPAFLEYFAWAQKPNA